MEYANVCISVSTGNRIDVYGCSCRVVLVGWMMVLMVVGDKSDPFALSPGSWLSFANN